MFNIYLILYHASQFVSVIVNKFKKYVENNDLNKFVNSQTNNIASVFITIRIKLSRLSTSFSVVIFKKLSIYI
ncbi:hypothetical protein GCM10008918_13020 [Lactobacillus kefiranofaciens subsp. kefiranofaciens]